MNVFPSLSWQYYFSSSPSSETQHVFSESIFQQCVIVAWAFWGLSWPPYFTEDPSSLGCVRGAVFCGLEELGEWMRGPQVHESPRLSARPRQAPRHRPPHAAGSDRYTRLISPPVQKHNFLLTNATTQRHQLISWEFSHRVASVYRRNGSATTPNHRDKVMAGNLGLCSFSLSIGQAQYFHDCLHEIDHCSRSSHINLSFFNATIFQSPRTVRYMRSFIIAKMDLNLCTGNALDFLLFDTVKCECIVWGEAGLSTHANFALF